MNLHSATMIGSIGNVKSAK